MPKLRIIIGQGTAGEVYQFTGTQGEYETVTIGPRGLWAVLPQTHAMGQPPHLLGLPGQKVPAFQAPTGKTAQGLAQFLDVNTYQSNLNQMHASQVGNRREFPTCKVTGIAPAGDKIIVHVTDSSEPALKGFMADQVILAVGIGPQKTPQEVGITVEGTPDTNLGFTQIEEGIEYLTHADKMGRNVVVYGGAATGAWVAAEVHAHMAQKQDAEGWMWVAARGGSGFSKGKLPGDRNAMILEQTDRQKRYDLKKAVYRQTGSLVAPVDDMEGVPSRPMLELTMEGESGLFSMLVDQLIYCIGGNPAGTGSIATMVDRELLEALEPLKDQNRMVSDGTGTLAWAMPTRELIMIGSATFNFQESSLHKQAQPAPMSMLPPNAQVPDGIAVTVSTIEALNTYMPVKPANGMGVDNLSFKQAASQKVKWNINFNTSNRTQIAAYLAETTDTDPFTANLQVALIVYLRSKNNFGLSETQVEFVLKGVEENIKKLRMIIPNLDVVRKHWDKTRGVDVMFQSHVDVMTQGPKWKNLWSSAQINS